MLFIEILYLLIYTFICGLLPLYVLYRHQLFIIKKLKLFGLGFIYSLSGLFSFVVAKIIKVKISGLTAAPGLEAASKLRMESFFEGLILIYPVILIGISITIFSHNIILEVKNRSN